MENIITSQLVLITGVTALLLGYLARPLTRALWLWCKHHILPSRYLRYHGRRVRKPHNGNVAQNPFGK